MFGNQDINLDFMDNRVELSDGEIKKRFYRFLMDYKEMPKSDFLFRKQIRHNYRQKRFFIQIDLKHLVSFDSVLMKSFVKNPTKHLPIFESVTAQIVEDVKPREAMQDEEGFDLPNALIEKTTEVCQLQFIWSTKKPQLLRELESKHVSRLIYISGIVTKASRFTHSLMKGIIECNGCKNQETISYIEGQSNLVIPLKCTRRIEGENSVCGGRYNLIAETCECRDTQALKIQELQEDVPSGEIPRSVIAIVNRYLVEQCVPGSRAKIVGVFTTGMRKGKSGGGAMKDNLVRYPFVKVLGIEKGLKYSTQMDKNAIPIFSDEDEEKFHRMARLPNLYEKMAQSVDPGIFGHSNIKKAILCQLFGGTPRNFRDGNRRRGDINVLLLGDPSTAKSQLLKFAQKVAPVSVYTSGKGSSAAGLTASVVREPRSREFYLEGGSMVLADGGLCCIDEFDKMGEQDRVAIHEAMEQQTISIAKAGITTVLNSRTAVLAAANPIGGKYYDFKSPEDQIDFQTTILSRFDMIFIVKDVLSNKQDNKIARHIISMMSKGNTLNNNSNNNAKRGGFQRRFMEDEEDEEDEDDEEENGRGGPQGKNGGGGGDGYFKKEDLTDYISYCRVKCFPRLSEEAVNFLSDFYVNERKKRKGGVIPVTVRQLEALIRISEALAKMHLEDVVTKRFAEEAVRLFKNSTVKAIQSGEMGEQMLKNNKDLEQIEQMIRTRVAVKSTVKIEWIIKILERNQKVSRPKVEQTIYLLVRKGDFDYRNSRTSLYRRK